MRELLFLGHLGATLCLVGLIWTIQVVHYPLMALVGEGELAEYHAAHSRAISWLVVPLMITELVTAVMLLFRSPPSFPVWAPWVGLVLILVIWGSTAFLQVPQHAVLASGFDAVAHQKLVTTNWLRTVAWSLRGALLLWLTARMW